MEIDLKELAQNVEAWAGSTNPETYAMAMAAIMQADCAARTAAAAEKQAEHLATIAGALNIMLDMLAEGMSDTDALTVNEDDNGLDYRPSAYPACATQQCQKCGKPVLDDIAHIGEEGEFYHPNCCPECGHDKPLDIRTAEQVKP
jgi:hypothetical protein